MNKFTITDNLDYFLKQLQLSHITSFFKKLNSVTELFLLLKNPDNKRKITHKLGKNLLNLLIFAINFNQALTIYNKRLNKKIKSVRLTNDLDMLNTLGIKIVPKFTSIPQLDKYVNENIQNKELLKKIFVNDSNAYDNLMLLISLLSFQKIYTKYQLSFTSPKKDNSPKKSSSSDPCNVFLDKKECDKSKGCKWHNQKCIKELKKMYDPCNIFLNKKECDEIKGCNWEKKICKKAIVKKINVGEQLLNELLQEHRLKPKDVGGGGDCYFRCIAYFIYGTATEHMRVRGEIVEWLRRNQEQYYSFIGDDMIENNAEWNRWKKANKKRFTVAMLSQKETQQFIFEKYLEIMSTRGVYAEGGLEFIATTQLYDVLLNIYTFGATQRNRVIRTIPDTSEERHEIVPGGSRVLNLLNIRQIHYQVLVSF